MRSPTIRHHATTISAVLFALLVAAPASAQGDRCQAPPGRSALEQYCEQLLGPGGPQGGRGGGGRVDRETARELRSAGGEGAALLGLAESSGGANGSGGGGSGGGGSAGDGGSADDTSGSGSSNAGAAGDAEDEPSGSVLSALTSSAEDGPTVGDALAWVLIAIAIGCFAVAWLGWRRRRGDEPESSA
jgi:hypothetical protein